MEAALRCGTWPLPEWGGGQRKFGDRAGALTCVRKKEARTAANRRSCASHFCQLLRVARRHTRAAAHAGAALVSSRSRTWPAHGRCTTNTAEERGKERPGARCGCHRAEFPPHLLQPLGGGDNPRGWVHWTTRCFLSLTQVRWQARRSQEPLAPSRVGSRSALAAAMICHFPLPQGLELSLVQWPAPWLTLMWLPGRLPLFSAGPLTRKPCSSQRMRTRRAGQVPRLPLPEIAGSPHGVEQRLEQLSVLLGTQLHNHRVPCYR